MKYGLQCVENNNVLIAIDKFYRVFTCVPSIASPSLPFLSVVHFFTIELRNDLRIGNKCKFYTGVMFNKKVFVLYKLLTKERNATISVRVAMANETKEGRRNTVFVNFNKRIHKCGTIGERA